MPTKLKIPNVLPKDKKHLLGAEYFAVIKVSTWKKIYGGSCIFDAYHYARKHKASVYDSYGRLDETFEGQN